MGDNGNGLGGQRWGRPHSGPFEFKYDYQRADLEVRGPSFYSTAKGGGRPSGLCRLWHGGHFSAADGVREGLLGGGHLRKSDSYAETIELIDTYAKHLSMGKEYGFVIEIGANQPE
jgi:hypothetical protein